ECGFVRAASVRVAGRPTILQPAHLAADPRNPPEARLFAASKVECEYELAAEERRNRPIIDLERVRATVAGLDSLVWRDPDRYASLLDTHSERAVKREEPLDDEEE